MPIKFRSACRLGVVAMPHGNILQADGRVEPRHGFLIAFVGNDVISGNMRMASINAGCDGNMIPQTSNYLSNLLEAAAEREFSAGGVFDQNCQPALCELQIFARGSDRGGGL